MKLRNIFFFQTVDNTDEDPTWWPSGSLIQLLMSKVTSKQEDNIEKSILAGEIRTIKKFRL